MYIEPDLAHAHIRAENHFNPFLGFKEPMYILKSSKCPTREQVEAALGPPSHVSERAYTDLYLHPPGQATDDAVDWIRLREVGKQYVAPYSFHRA